MSLLEMYLKKYFEIEIALLLQKYIETAFYIAEPTPIDT
jgi:hypothetical protein